MHCYRCCHNQKVYAQDERAGELPGTAVAQDALTTQDDELDMHPAMLPLVRFIERAAALATNGQELAGVLSRLQICP